MARAGARKCKQKWRWDPLGLSYADREIQARRPDTVLMDGENNQRFIVNVTIPGDDRVIGKKMEKVEKVDVVSCGHPGP